MTHEPKTTDRNIWLPYEGLFCSSLSEALDCAVDYLKDNEGRYRLSDECDPWDYYWPEGYKEATGQITIDQINRSLRTHLGIKCDWLSFVEVISPREYNFQTDRLFGSIGIDQARALLILSKRKDNHKTLKATIEQYCTSRSGFTSFYSRYLEDWISKPVTSWDANELGILLRAILALFDGSEWEDTLFSRVHETVCEQGKADEAFCIPLGAFHDLEGE